MDKPLSLLMQKPFKDLSKPDQDLLMKLVGEAVKQGTKVVLGNKRCFFCGIELGEVSGMKGDTNNPMIITNLCHKCYNLQNSIRPTSSS